MKKILVILCVLFVGAAVADTITVNWYNEGSVYDTTTCDIGDDLILPTAPTKYGYTFQGWMPEHFDRGTYSTWQDVPDTESSYPQNKYGNRTPLDGDYIFVQEYIPTLRVVTISTGANNATISVTILDTQQTFQYQFTSVFSRTRIGNTNFYITYNSIVSTSWTLISDGAIKIGNSNDSVYSYSWKFNAKVDFIVNATGLAKFVYDGVWSVDGKNGWQREQTN